MTADPVQKRLRDSLYSEAMLLADEARSYFDEAGARDTAELPPVGRVHFSCEALKVTTRIMHVVAWLLTQRAVDAGEISAVESRLPARRLGDAPESGAGASDGMPDRARALILASADLYRRVAHLDRTMDDSPSPARALQERLARSL